MKHHEKDFTDYLEEAIMKIDGAIEQQYAKMAELRDNKQIGSSHFSELYCQYEDHISGLREAKNILLGK